MIRHGTVSRLTRTWAKKKGLYVFGFLMGLMALWGYQSLAIQAHQSTSLRKIRNIYMGYGDLEDTVRFEKQNKSTKNNGVDPKKKYPRICCAILTDPNMLSQTQAVRDTWTRRCEKRFFMSSQDDKSFPTIGVGNDTRLRTKLIVKMTRTWLYLYDHHLSDCDYFVKGDPDTYMIIENLKSYLLDFHPDTPQHFGHVYHVKPNNITYMAGGPGEVLSRGALKVLVEKALRTNNTKKYKVCHVTTGGEDKAMGQCLVLAGSQCVNTLDKLGRPRFIVYDLDYVFKGIFEGWYLEQHIEPTYKGSNCCSDFPIGFHYVTPERMYIMEYIFYQVHKIFDLGVRPVGTPSSVTITMPTVPPIKPVKKIKRSSGNVVNKQIAKGRSVSRTAPKGNLSATAH